MEKPYLCAEDFAKELLVLQKKMEDKRRAPEPPTSAAPGAPRNTASVRVILAITQINLSPPVNAI